MVTYCLGSARQKRAYFLRQNAVLLDNIEVVFCASENGKNHFAYGKLPFAEFTAYEYLKYSTALCGGEIDYALLSRCGVRLTTRIGKLCPAAMRCVQLAEKQTATPCDAVVINLDGTRYTRRNAKFLRALIAECKNAYVLVTDKKFVKKAKRVDRLMRFGKATKTQNAFYRAKRVAEYCKKKLGISVTKIGTM